MEKRTEEMDFSRAIQTLNRKLVTILTTDGPNPEFPIVGYVSGETEIYTWNKAGDAHKREFDLEYTPIKDKYYISVTEAGSRVFDDFAELTMYPNVMAQIIVDPANKTVRVQGFNGTKIEDMSKPTRTNGQMPPPPAPRKNTPPAFPTTLEGIESSLGSLGGD